MKKFVMLAIGAMMTLPSLARDFYYEYEGQTLAYTVLDEEARTVETRAGHDNFPNLQYSPGNEVSGSLVIPAVAKDGDVEYTVTKLGQMSFLGNEGLTSVIIPQSVTLIDFGAFDSCTGLTELRIPESVTLIGNSAFYGCTGLTEVKIPDSVVTVEESAFRKCSSLHSVTIGRSVKSMSNFTFIDCNSLTEVYFNAVDCVINLLFFNYEARPCFPPTVKKVVFGDDVINVPGYTFENCTELTEVTIGNSVERFGSVFMNCSGITEVVLPNSVMEIGQDAFNNCSGLKEINFPESLTKIGSYAFNRCSSLTSVSLPASITEIGFGAFSGCSFQEFSIADLDRWIKVKFNNYASNPISIARRFSIGGKEIKHLDLAAADAEISSLAFFNAENLETIRVKAAEIGGSCFNWCSNVTDICIDVKKIADLCFANWKNLKAVYSMTEEPPVAYKNSFGSAESVDKVTLYVPAGSRAKYQAAECWKDFTNIVETDFAGIDEIFKADYSSGSSGIDDIVSDRNESAAEIDFNAPVEVYNLGGMRVAESTGNLPAGIYIVKQGAAVRKISVK